MCCESSWNWFCSCSPSWMFERHCEESDTMRLFSHLLLKVSNFSVLPEKSDLKRQNLICDITKMSIVVRFNKKICRKYTSDQFWSVIQNKISVLGLADRSWFFFILFHQFYSVREHKEDFLLLTSSTLLAASSVDKGECMGGSTLSLLHDRTFNFTGDSQAQELCLYLTKAASVPYFEILEKWIYRGIIKDPYRCSSGSTEHISVSPF